jgi:hypothetical protein
VYTAWEGIIYYQNTTTNGSIYYELLVHQCTNATTTCWPNNLAAHQSRGREPAKKGSIIVAITSVKKSEKFSSSYVKLLIKSFANCTVKSKLRKTNTLDSVLGI